MSKSWQRAYLAACLSQLVLEVVVFQTAECLWIYLAVPKLISQEVDAAMASMHQAINAAFRQQDDKREAILNSSAHFFASREVAEFFPHLFEASVVLAFQSFHPPATLDLLLPAGNQGRGESRSKSGATLSSSWGPALLRRCQITAAFFSMMRFTGI